MFQPRLNHHQKGKSLDAFGNAIGNALGGKIQEAEQRRQESLPPAKRPQTPDMKTLPASAPDAFDLARLRVTYDVNVAGDDQNQQTSLVLGGDPDLPKGSFRDGTGRIRRDASFALAVNAQNAAQASDGRFITLADGSGLYRTNHGLAAPANARRYDTNLLAEQIDPFFKVKDGEPQAYVTCYAPVDSGGCFVRYGIGTMNGAKELFNNPDRPLPSLKALTLGEVTERSLLKGFAIGAGEAVYELSVGTALNARDMAVAGCCCLQYAGRY